MDIHSALQYVAFIIVLTICVKPLGGYLERVFVLLPLFIWERGRQSVTIGICLTKGVHLTAVTVTAFRQHFIDIRSPLLQF